MIRQAVLLGTHDVNTATAERSCRRQGGLCTRPQRGHRGQARLVRGGLLVALVLAASGCATLHVPAVRPSFSVKEFAEAETEEIMLRARAILGKESYSELFDDDLPQVGILAVWIALENRSKKEITFDPKRWQLLAANSLCPAMSPNEMVDRYYRERRLRLYFVHADERARDSLEELSLQRGRLAPGASAEGFVFFRIDGSALPSWNLRATLMAKGIKRGGGRKLDMQLPLYAHS